MFASDDTSLSDTFPCDDKEDSRPHDFVMRLDARKQPGFDSELEQSNNMGKHVRFGDQQGSQEIEVLTIV